MSARGRPGVWLVLAGLLVLPALAVHRILAAPLPGYVAGWGLLASVLTWMVYAVDKRRARENAGRVPERLLHLLELAGGWPGAFLAQHILRHKNAKVSYQAMFWLIVLLYEVVALDAWRGWPLWHQLTG